MKVAILTNIIPSYRIGFYDNIINGEEAQFTIYCQKEPSSQQGFKSIHARYRPYLKEVKYFSFGKDKLVWHLFPYFKILRENDVFIVDGNPRHLSLALFSTIAKIINKKVIILSVCYSRNNNFLFGKLRLFWWKMFDYFLMYNPCDIENMKKEGFGGKKMVSINNGLDQNEINNSIRKWTLNRLLKFQAENNLGGKDIFISIGRVIEGRFDLMLDAVKLLSKEFPNVLWVLIGKGEGERKLKQKIREKSLEQNVLFTGAIYQENEIAPWMMSALGYVHPAPIGLSLLHAYGYGLPVITTNEVALQGPEFCAFEEGKTGLLYQDGNAESLSVQCRKLLNSQQCFEKDYIAAIPKDKYNTDIMYTQLVKIINA